MRAALVPMLQAVDLQKMKIQFALLWYDYGDISLLY